MSMLEKREDVRGRALLVGLCCDSAADFDNSDQDTMAELQELLTTAGGETVLTAMQNRHTPDPRTFIGEGKVQELKELIQANSIDLVIFDNELSPAQGRALEEELACRVIDRNALILDIFADRANTAEGKLQVELAQLKYTAPRLMGRGAELSRLGGGIGTRGPGESQLETDRRHLQRRIHALERDLEELAAGRRTQRQARDRSGLPRLAIVGYTNAGKSTLLNYLTDAGILAKDQLFATLDPTTRKCRLPGGETVLLTDTVGFIRNLPHHLIHAFRSTLEEAVYADLLLIVVDASDPEAQAQLQVTEELLESLGAGGKPTLYVFNKCDLGAARPGMMHGREHVAYISAATGQGVDMMMARVEEILHAGKRRVTFRIPNAKQGLVSRLYESATVEDVEYGADGVTVTAVVDAKAYGPLREYDVAPVREENEDE